MLKSLAKCSVFSVKTEARAPRGDQRRAGRSLRLGRGPSGGRHARTGNRSGQRVSPAASSNSCRRLATRERAVGITRRRKCPRNDGGGRVEARETTRREVGGRARTPCWAGGESAVVARVSPLHLNYCVSLYRNEVLGFLGSGASAPEGGLSADAGIRESCCGWAHIMKIKFGWKGLSRRDLRRK